MARRTLPAAPSATLSPSALAAVMACFCDECALRHRHRAPKSGYPQRSTVRPVRRPDRHKVPMRSIRVPDDLWNAVKRKAADRGETVTAAILRLLRRYVEDD